MSKGVLVDTTRCIGCRSCQIACKAWHDLEARYKPSNGKFTSPEKLSADCYTLIEFFEKKTGDQPSWKFVKEQCLHCQDPACASACPVGALKKTPEGPVVYNQWLCIGCRYCMLACPFQIPKYEWDTTDPWVQKCNFCASRVASDMAPACVKACPMDVMYFDDYAKVAQEAERRIKNFPGKYVNHIYGYREAGGTSWMYIADRPFRELGFNTDVPESPYPAMTWGPSLSNILWEEAGLLAVLGGILYLRNRRNHEEGKK